MSKEKPVRVLIVDDHAIVRSGLKNFLYAYEWITPIGEATNGAEAVSMCTALEVDVVLMDVVMPEGDGIEATRQITALGKAVKVIILTSFHEQDQVEQALKAGATSYLLKNVTAEDLAHAIRSAAAGQSVLAPEATTALIDAARRKPAPNYDLTEREREVLALLVKGFSNAEIAARLSISMATAKFHLTNIFSKLGVKNRVEAATIALENQLVPKE